jgi:HK97 gp10 family phage protein
MARVRKNPVMAIEGADDINAALKMVENRAAGLTLLEAATAGGKVVAEEASRRAPKDSGDLAKSIDARAIKTAQVGRAQIDIGPTRDAWYGRLVELGTVKMRAKPFLRPAFDAKAEEATNEVAAQLRKALREFLS